MTLIQITALRGPRAGTRRACGCTHVGIGPRRAALPTADLARHVQRGTTDYFVLLGGEFHRLTFDDCPECGEAHLTDAEADCPERDLLARLPEL
jgi:hypothetical protein